MLKGEPELHRSFITWDLRVVLLRQRIQPTDRRLGRLQLLYLFVFVLLLSSVLLPLWLLVSRSELEILEVEFK